MHIGSKITLKKYRTLPKTPGVYIFKSKDKVLYVGKSIQINARVASHIENAKTDRKEHAIMSQSDNIEYYITDSEFKALLLEAQLIHDLQPKYNVIWKDNKTPLYIKIDTNVIYPLVHITRKESPTLATYFGPYPSVKSVELLLREIRKVVPFCMQKKLGTRSCFYRKLLLCNPCPSEINNTRDLTLKSKLIKKYTSNIKTLIRILNGETNFILKDLQGELKEHSSILNYEEALVLRNRIQRFQRLIHERLFSSNILTEYNRSEEALTELSKILIPYFPRIGLKFKRIECYDISNIGMQNAVGSVVVATDGIVDRSQYRKFKIKNDSDNDFDRLLHVLERRGGHRDWPMPDLIVIDGGRPQIEKVRNSLHKNYTDVPYIGLAKNPDRIVVGVDGFPTVKPSFHNIGFSLLRQLRDEAHRFALTYHRKLRDKGLLY